MAVVQEISPAVHKKMRRLTHGAEKRRDKTKARSLVGKRASLTCCFLRLLELLLQAATAKYQTSRLFVQKRTRFVQGPAVLALDVPCPLPVPSLVGYERLLRFFRVICMAIAQVSVTPPARSAMPSAICGRGASPVAASAAAFAGACLESVVLGKGLGASGFDSGFGAGV